MRDGRTGTALSISDKVSKVSLTKLSQVSSAYIQYEAKQEIVGADTKQIGIKSVYCPVKCLFVENIEHKSFRRVLTLK